MYVGACVAHSVERLTLGFSSSHDLMVLGIKPHTGLRTDSEEPASYSLSPALSVPAPLMRSLSNKK